MKFDNYISDVSVIYIDVNVFKSISKSRESNTACVGSFLSAACSMLSRIWIMTVSVMRLYRMACCGLVVRKKIRNLSSWIYTIVLVV